MKSKNDKFVNLLLEWFKSNKRDFSWRKKNLTPFQILTAEILLQKTNANQVEKIFPSFMSKYQDAKSIDEMNEEDLALELQPLGLFNRRARDLKKTARFIVENENKIPDSKKGLMGLPGVGEYISNAVLCFAFNERVPIVDSNVGRVIKRVYSFPVKGAPSRDKKLAEKMLEIIPEKNFKEFNHAILDFAALVCLPKKPKCNKCSIQEICDFIQKK